MEAKCSSPVAAADLAKTCKNLKATATHEHDNSLECDPKVADRVAELYEKHDGDLLKIFQELGACPRKALKHPPASAREFGIKYAQGFYSFAEEK